MTSLVVPPMRPRTPLLLRRHRATIRLTISSERPRKFPIQAQPAGDSIDDLFGSLPAPVIEETVAELPAPIEAVEPTGIQVVATTTETSSLADTRVRTWIDNTGHYHVEGRLIEINSDNVRLLKSNGRTCTVAFERLSEADAAYVKSIRAKLLAANFAMLTGK